MGLGAYGGAGGHVDLDVLLALAVHTVPLVAVVTLAYRAQSGVRAACLRSAGLALASVVGVVASSSVSEEASHHFSAWVAAGVAGLLVHVVTHDLERDLPTGTGARLFDLAAALLGVIVTVGASAMGGHEPHDAGEPPRARTRRHRGRFEPLARDRLVPFDAAPGRARGSGRVRARLCATRRGRRSTRSRSPARSGCARSPRSRPARDRSPAT